MGGGIKDEDWGEENNSVSVAQPSQNKLLCDDSNSKQKHGTMAEELNPDPENPENTGDDLTEMGEGSIVPILMSERNKETLRNIRLRQLQRDCPHTRDFYNLTLKIREANQGNKPVEVKSLMQKLYPFFRWGNGEEDGERPYQPALSSHELAISLGKIKIYSPCAPKNCLDPDLSEKLRLGVGPAVPFSTSTDPSKARMRLVYTQIERLYGYLLTYEESEARISLLKYKCEFDEDLRHGALDKATRILMDSEHLLNITKVEKGRMVVSRLMAVMDPSMGAKLITSLIPSFASWELDSDRKTQQVYIRFSFCIYIAKQVDFQIILTALNEDAISAMILFELGSSFLMMVLLRGQQLYDESAPDDSEFQKIWKKFFEMATRTFGLADSLIPPIEIFPEFLNRLKGDEKFTIPENREYWQNLFQICKDNGSIVSDGF